jgi:hypothetical protein
MSDEKRRASNEIRKLIETAFERELRSELSTLAASFEEWRRDTIDTFELERRIEAYTDGKARKLADFYRLSAPHFAIAHAVAHGYLQEDEVAAELIRQIQPIIQFARDHPE